MAEPLAARSPRDIATPTIGIGASPACDGQILVLEDMLGLSPRAPKFVKRYSDLGGAIEEAVATYAKRGAGAGVSGPEHVYGLKAKAPANPEPGQCLKGF